MEKAQLYLDIFNDSFYSYHIQIAPFLIYIYILKSLYLSLKQWKIDLYDFFISYNVYNV